MGRHAERIQKHRDFGTLMIVLHDIKAFLATVNAETSPQKFSFWVQQIIGSTEVAAKDLAALLREGIHKYFHLLTLGALKSYLQLSPDHELVDKIIDHFERLPWPTGEELKNDLTEEHPAFWHIRMAVVALRIDEPEDLPAFSDLVLYKFPHISEWYAAYLEDTADGGDPDKGHENLSPLPQTSVTGVQVVINPTPPSSEIQGEVKMVEHTVLRCVGGRIKKSQDEELASEVVSEGDQRLLESHRQVLAMGAGRRR
jgi:hypothetical protein